MRTTRTARTTRTTRMTRTTIEKAACARLARCAILSSMRRGEAGGVFAIADIHGCDEELRLLLRQLPLTRDSRVIFLGDYIDRGPNSRGVVETILELQEYCHVTCLLGNHELMLREFLDGSDPRLSARFIYNGGGATLASYSNDDAVFVIPEGHVESLEKPEYF